MRKSIADYRLPFAGWLLFVPILTSIALGQNLSRDTIPGKWLEPLLPEDLPKLEYSAYYNDLDKARLQAFSGRYKLALMTLAKAKDADPVEVALIKARALAATGRAKEAIDALSANDPRVQILRANLLAESGKTSDAIALLKQVIEKNPKSLAGHYYLAAISEQVGDLATARQQYAWFVDAPQEFLKKLQAGGGEALKLDSAEDITLLGRALDRWAQLNSEYQNNESLHNAILNCFVHAYDVVDRRYWPARVAAAEYFLSHDNDQEAGNELKTALSANPQDEQSIALLGSIAIAQFNFDGADRAVAKIHAFNPNSIRADILEARNLLHQRRPDDAQKPIQLVLSQQPSNTEALGLLAATQSLRLHDDQAAATLKQVESIDPNNASAYLEVAEQLGAMRQYPRAAAMYKIAIERAPWWTSARNGLGLLYTQSGDEDQARITLDAAHTIDPFNLQTTNYLRLLDDLAKFARKESTNFIVMYDAARDPIIPEYFSEYLETVHDAVCGDFHHTPAVKTFIEVFPTHDAFSVRTTGSPWIGTVGASTGRVIALCSPRAGENTLGTFNWSQVLRHEFTHTVTLSMTDNRIPHWMTEGLAVWEEHTPMRWEWEPMIYHAVTHDELFDLDELTWGFVRPKKPTDRQLAYAESYWICTYIEEKYGHESILKMLDGFKAGQSEEQVFESVLNKSRSQFYDEFLAWTKKQIAGWGYDEETSKKYKELRDKAEEMIKMRQYDQAVKAWEEIVALRPVDALPHQRLAGLFLTKEANKPEKAIEHLVALSRVELKDNRYAKRVARLYRDMGKLDEAQKYAMTAVYTDPYDPDAHALLAEIYEKSGDERGLARETRVIPVLNQWIKENRKRSLGE